MTRCLTATCGKPRALQFATGAPKMVQHGTQGLVHFRRKRVANGAQASGIDAVTPFRTIPHGCDAAHRRRHVK